MSSEILSSYSAVRFWIQSFATLAWVRLKDKYRDCSQEEIKFDRESGDAVEA